MSFLEDKQSRILSLSGWACKIVKVEHADNFLILYKLRIVKREQ